MGPTASGKTDLAAELTQQFDIELISVDAAQVYRRMNIGTGKPDARFLKQFPHHLIDIRNPVDTYNVAQFASDAMSLIQAIHDRGRIPLLVGGTMFYFKALESGLSNLPSADETLRVELEREWRERGAEFVHNTLADIDPDIATKIRPSDTQRLLRALEIYHLTGEAPSRVMAQSQGTGICYPLIKLALNAGHRKALHERIELRFLSMVRQGLIDEVRSLLDVYPSLRECPAARIVGYRQTLDYLDGRCDKKGMIDAAVAATRQLAKRQLTWLRQQSNVVWFDVVQPDTPRAVSTYLQHHPLIQSP